MTKTIAKSFFLVIALGLTVGVGCKKKEEVVDVESTPSTTTTTPTTTPEPTPDSNDKPSSVKDGKKDNGAKTDKNKGTGASTGEGAAWLKKASGSLAKAFVTRSKDGVYAASSKSKSIQIKLERYKGGKAQSKKVKMDDAKIFTQCLISGPKFKKCPIKEFPIKNNKAGKIESCDAECCKFTFKKDDLKPSTAFLTKACFKKPSSPKDRPKLKAVKMAIGG